ncbi:MAG TPA: DUF4129 domain-containing protein [Anaerolineaceae bacterium]|nr:DUF4129 domain-containing protein [Anaerolineaceae bacterium]
MSTAAASTPAIPIRLRLWLEGAGILRILMLSIWVTSWYQVLMGQRIGWGAAFGALTVIAGGSFYLTRLFRRLELPPKRARLFFGLWLAAVLVFSLQAMVLGTRDFSGSPIVDDLVESAQVFDVDIGIFVHLIVVVFLSWRGIAMAQSAMDQGEAAGSFQAGIVAFLLYGLVFGNSLPAQSFFPVYAFLLVSLVCLATARITDLATARGGRLPASFIQWWLPILGAAAVVVAAALFSGWLVGNQVSYLAVALLAAFVTVMFLVSVVVALPVLAVVYLALPWLSEKFSEGLELLPIQNPNEIADRIFGEDVSEITRSMSGLDEGYTILLGLILLAVIAAVIVSLRARTLKRRYALQTDNPAAIRPFGRDKWLPDELRFPNPFGGASRFLAAARIRRVYWDLMRLSGQLGTPRPPAATPLEYLPLLDRVFPSERENLRRITTAYLQVRYGEAPESEAEVSQVLTAWKHIQGAGQRLLREQRKAKRQARSA